MVGFDTYTLRVRTGIPVGAAVTTIRAAARAKAIPSALEDNEGGTG
jgi:hypothetical protein